MISLLPTLTEIAKIRGKVTDVEIEECMGHLIEFESNTRKSDSCAMNHGRTGLHQRTREWLLAPHHLSSIQKQLLYLVKKSGNTDAATRSAQHLHLQL